MNSKGLLTVLVILNLLVLMGQLWPAGEPPFSRAINIVFLIMSFLYFAAALTKAKKDE